MRLMADGRQAFLLRHRGRTALMVLPTPTTGRASSCGSANSSDRGSSRRCTGLRPGSCVSSGDRHWWSGTGPTGGTSPMPAPTPERCYGGARRLPGGSRGHPRALRPQHESLAGRRHPRLGVGGLCHRGTLEHARRVRTDPVAGGPHQPRPLRQLLSQTDGAAVLSPSAEVVDVGIILGPAARRRSSPQEARRVVSSSR